MIELSVALVIVAFIARDCFVRRLKSLDLQGYHTRELERVGRELNAVNLRVTELREERDGFVKQLAEDWKRKFSELERGNNELRKHIDSQVAGTIAQLPATGGGFNRRNG